LLWVGKYQPNGGAAVKQFLRRVAPPMARNFMKSRSEAWWMNFGGRNATQNRIAMP
jgi:hypothetical protein